MKILYFLDHIVESFDIAKKKHNQLDIIFSIFVETSS